MFCQWLVLVEREMIAYCCVSLVISLVHLFISACSPLSYHHLKEIRMENEVGDTINQMIFITVGMHVA